jgi:MYXO-CTERM domain-containing protein
VSPGVWPGALAAAAILAVSGATYVRNKAGNACLYWGTRQVSYAISDFAPPYGALDVCASTTDPAAAQAAVRASFDAWTAAGGQVSCTDLQLVNDGGTGGFTSSTDTGYDHQNLVVFRKGPCASVAPGGASDPCFANHTCGDTYNCWDTTAANHGDPKIIALTTTSYNTRTGQILDADMELNAADPAAGTGLPAASGYYFTCGPMSPPPCTALGETGCVYVDVQNTVTHEAGHFIGFAHNPDLNSTMYLQAPIGDTSKRSLAAEDIQGVCDVYPTGRPALTCGTNSSGCGCGTAGAEGVLGLAAVALAWRRRPRRETGAGR